jgi:hypothetical protein
MNAEWRRWGGEKLRAHAQRWVSFLYCFFAKPIDFDTDLW